MNSSRPGDTSPRPSKARRVLALAGALILGVGMCLTMGKIGGGTDTAFALGVAGGVVGLTAMGVN